VGCVSRLASDLALLALVERQPPDDLQTRGCLWSIELPGPQPPSLSSFDRHYVSMIASGFYIDNVPRSIPLQQVLSRRHACVPFDRNSRYHGPS